MHHLSTQPCQVQRAQRAWKVACEINDGYCIEQCSWDWVIMHGVSLRVATAGGPWPRPASVVAAADRIAERWSITPRTHTISPVMEDKVSGMHRISRRRRVAVYVAVAMTLVGAVLPRWIEITSV